MDVRQNVIDLLSIYADARRIAVTSACVYAAGQARLVDRLLGDPDSGRPPADITTRRAARIVQWLSDHWPAGAEWPADIPRPAPSADAPAVSLAPPHAAGGAGVPSAAGASAEGAGDPVALVEALQREIVDLTGADPIDHDAIAALEGRMFFDVALKLGEDGTIASPNALCAALGCPRDVYDATVRLYADAGTGGRPRETSRYGRMLRALRLAGDVRVTGRRAA